VLLLLLVAAVVEEDETVFVEYPDLALLVLFIGCFEFDALPMPGRFWG
jgi:hypothetical protein